jgi:hypothetical protein
MARTTAVLLPGIVMPAVTRYTPRRERRSSFINGAGGDAEHLSANLVASLDSPVGRPDAGPVT